MAAVTICSDFPKIDKTNLCCKSHDNDYLWWEWMTEGGWGNFVIVGLVMFLDLSTVGASGKKNPPAKAGDVRDMRLIPGPGRSPGRGMATHSSILA